VSQVKIAKTSSLNGILDKVKDIGVLMKFKLSLTVVFSAVMSYMIAIQGSIILGDLLVLFLGGLFTSGAACGLNQVLEKDYDTMMKRTENRPIAAGRMTVSEGVLISGSMSLVGVSLLAYFNPISAFIGMISLISYAFIYTPVKRISNIAVTIGAFPGALPIVIGCTAAQNGVLTPLAIALFAIQFIWQFPHFFAIAWLGDEDYKKAGFKLLPTKDGEKDSDTGKQSLIYALMLLPLSWLPYYLGATGLNSAIYLTVLALIMAYFAFVFYKKNDRKTALTQMFYSIAYLPFALIGLYLDKM
jgi:heme o synthase